MQIINIYTTDVINISKTLFFRSSSSSDFCVASKACLPETLVRSTTLILGAEAATALQSKIENQQIQIPSAATISRARVKMDESWQN